MVKIYTHFSDSHKQLYNDYFKVSLRKLYTSDELCIKYLHHEQTTTNGYFMEQGWLEAMNFKLDVILSAFDDTSEDWFIFSDCDVQFFTPFLNDLSKYLENGVELACQDDCNTLCAGFFVCRKTNKTQNLFKNVKANFKHMGNDQAALNNFKYDVKYRLLDKNLYYTIGNFFNNSDGTNNWDGASNVFVPDNIYIHHANYVKGVEQKIKLMDKIKNTINV